MTANSIIFVTFTGVDCDKNLKIYLNMQRNNRIFWSFETLNFSEMGSKNLK